MLKAQLFDPQIYVILQPSKLSFWLYMGSAAAWFIVYAVTLYYIFKQKFVQIPAFAVALNVGWEFAWTALPHAINSKWLWYMWIPGVMIDCYLFYSILRYGMKQSFPQPMVAHFKTIMTFTLVGFGLFFFWFAADGYDLPMGVLSAMVYSVVMAAWFVDMEFRLDEKIWLSSTIGWAKMAGDLFLSAYCFATNPNRYSFLYMGLLCLVYDVIYIYRVYYRTRNPSVQPPA